MPITAEKTEYGNQSCNNSSDKVSLMRCQESSKEFGNIPNFTVHPCQTKTFYNNYVVADVKYYQIN